MALKASVKFKGQKWHFVQDAELREILARDYHELKKLIKVGAHKSAIVLSGSIMEAVLVAALRNDQSASQAQYTASFPRAGDKPIDRWALHELITVAAGRERVGDNLKSAASVVQDYRNLIHPMAEQRKNAVIDSNAVNAVVALMVGVLNHLAHVDEVGQGTELDRFYYRLGRTRGEAEAQVAKAIIDWSRTQELQDHWSPALNYMPRINYRGQWIMPLAVRPTGQVHIRFAALKRSKTVFRYRDERRQLAERLNAIVGIRVRPQDEDKNPSIKYKLLTGEVARAQLLECLTWVVQTIRQPAQE